jgi:uroporphyrinogen-III synthase
LLLTSPNAARQAGPALDKVAKLPVYAVGAKTAAAARDAGLTIAAAGSAAVEALLESIPGSLRLLHLAGADRRETTGRHRIDRLTVYRSEQVADPALPNLAGLVVAVHSPRAGARLAELAPARSETAVAAISTNAAVACGTGWQRVERASCPDDASLLALAATLCQTLPPR